MIRLFYASTVAYVSPIFITDDNKGVFKSEDGGITWQAVNKAGNTDLSRFPILKMIIDKVAPNMMYAVAGFEGVFESVNAGTTWEQMTRSGLPTPVYVGNFALADRYAVILTSSGIYKLSDQSIFFDRQAYRDMTNRAAHDPYRRFGPAIPETFDKRKVFQSC